MHNLDSCAFSYAVGNVVEEILIYFNNLIVFGRHQEETKKVTEKLKPHRRSGARAETDKCFSETPKEHQTVRDIGLQKGRNSETDLPFYLCHLTH